MRNESNTNLPRPPTNRQKQSYQSNTYLIDCCRALAALVPSVQYNHSVHSIILYVLALAIQDLTPFS